MKVIRLLPILFVIIIAIFLIPQKAQNSNDFLRIHIRANSNLDQDQNVKYEVKAKVVEYLTPYLCEVDSKQDAMNFISSMLQGIEKVSDSVLRSAGYNYKSRASIDHEYFPSRQYDDLVLEADYYDALIIRLGEGTGDNWWCVVYPPMCFVNKNSNSLQDIIYKSKLLEIIKKFFA